MPDPTSFFDETAAFYEATYEPQDIDDVGFYLQRARAADGPVLEVACGTGRVYLELLSTGIDADGFDGAPGMLSELRSRADERGLEPSVWEADMRDFEVDREYALIIVPFRSFLHLLEIEDQRSALRQFHDALAPDGELIIAVFAPNFEVMCERYGEWTERAIEYDGGEYTVRDRTTFADEVEQIVESTREIRGPSGDVVARGQFELKLLPKREFELLLETSPFETYEVYGGFDLDPLESTGQEMVWVIEP